MEITIDRDQQIKILEDFFQGLSTMDQRKIFTSAFKKASKPLIAAAKGLAPVGRTGRLRASIGALMLPNDITIIVGARKFSGHKGHHGHLVENGTAMRFRKNGGATGSVNPTHFFENAFNMTENRVYTTIEEEWYNEIDRFIVRTNKKLK